MLSALLQAYVEDVFQDAAKRAFPAYAANDQAFDLYWKQMKGWGNPSDDNISRLFLKIGVPDVFLGLSWQRTNTVAVRRMLDQLNQVRNKIAHGAAQITVNNTPYSLTLARVQTFRNMVNSFSDRFDGHVRTFIP